MDKGRIKRSVVTCAVLVGLSVSPQAQAGWLSDRWNDFTESIDDVIEEVKDFVDDKIIDPFEDLVGDALEDAVVFALQNGAGKGADYLIELLLKLPMLDGEKIFNLLVDLMENKSIITDQIMMEMMYNSSMVGIIESSIGAASDAEQQERAEEFFAVAVARFMPILVEGKVEINIDKIPASVFYMFSNLGTTESNTDGLELAWENMLRSAMSSGEAAQAFFGMLMQVDPLYQKAMLDFMFLGNTGNGLVHHAQSVNFIQAMVEGMMNGLNSGTMSQEALGGLVQNLMPILAIFDAQGNMTGMTPYGERFFATVATKAMICQNPQAGQFAQMMMGMLPPGMVLPLVTNTEVCGTPEEAGRIVDIDAIALINSNSLNWETTLDSDQDGIPDFMDPTPNGEVIDTDNDGIPDVSDVDVDGDGINDNGVDTDGDGVNNAHDDDIDGDGIINEEDSDIDGDGIRNEEDADINGDGIMDNGPDTDNDGINNANDSDIDGDGTPNAEDSDIDGDGLANDIDADADSYGGVDDGKTDTDGDGIVDSADADVDGDGTVDNGPDADNDGISDTVDTAITTTVSYYYGEDGVLRDSSNNPVVNEKYSDDENVVTHLVVVLPGNKQVEMKVPMDLLYTDAEGNRIMVSDILDDKGSRFVISMTTDGFGKVFIGNEVGGFEMSGYLAGMKENEYLTFSVVKKDDGTLEGKTTIIPKDKELTFGSSNFNQ